MKKIDNAVRIRTRLDNRRDEVLRYFEKHHIDEFDPTTDVSTAAHV